MEEYVKVTKVSEVEHAKHPTPNMSDYEPGEPNYGVSLPSDYTVTGWLHNDVEVGKRVIIRRDTRNGLKISGVMNTSPVTKIELSDEGMVFHTLNSIYRLEWLKEDKEK